MRSGEDVVHLLAAVDGGIALHAINHLGQTVEDLDAGFLKLHAHQNRQKAADNAGEDRENQVECADILWLVEKNQRVKKPGAWW